MCYVCITSCSSHVAHMMSHDESCGTYDESVHMCHITGISHVTHIDDSCGTYVMSHVEYVMSHMFMSHVAHANESCRTCEGGMSQISTCHGTHMNESCRIYQRLTSHI